MNLLVALTYHPAQIRSIEDFRKLTQSEQGKWHEWLIAQELQRRTAIRDNELLEPLKFWQSKQHEIDFYDGNEQFIEVKRGACSPLEFAWFTKQFPQSQLTVLNNASFSTESIRGLTFEDYLLQVV